MDRMKGKVAIVSGAASGMGKCVAGIFAREGAKVACVDRNLDAAEETVGIIKSAGGEATAVATGHTLHHP